jgi:hypothetical protein
MIGPFEAHLVEAIALNRERLPLYARLTDGASLPISRRLIRLEQWTRPLARVIDRRAAPFQARGIGIARDEFASMQETPPFREWVEIPAGARFAPIPGGRVARRIRAAQRSGGFAGAATTVEAELTALAAAPCFHCMLRHLLESALRVCELAPVHAAAAAEQTLPSPEPISRWMLRLHLLGLGAAARLDGRAALLQARGVPILCQDVPAVPSFAAAGSDPERSA